MKAFKIQKVLEFLENDGQSVVFTGESDTEIVCIANIKALEDNCISWIKKKSFLTEQVKLSIQKHKNILIVAPFSVDNANTIITNNPKRTFFSILNEFCALKPAVGIHSTAIVETDKIGSNVTIGAHCFIGPDVQIDDNVIIHHNVVIECPCIIGEGTEIFSGVVIGTEGFGYFYDDNNIPVREQHYMGVKIGKNVDIGANACIDRGLLGDTIIGDNVKIDNHSFIAHNNVIHDNVLMTGGVILGGSVEIGKNAYLAPGSVVLNQKIVNENAYIGIGSVVLTNVGKDSRVFGVPAKLIKFN